MGLEPMALERRRSLCFVDSYLMKVRAFRVMIARGLHNQSICGFIEWRAPGTVTFQITNYMNGNRWLALPEGDRPAELTQLKIRWCDWIAWLIVRRKADSVFSPFAPLAKRDEAIQKADSALAAP